MRVHLGCEDDAFGCMGNGEDSEGIKGVFLRRNVVNVAGRALKVNLQRLGPLVLPISEMVRSSSQLLKVYSRVHSIVPCFGHILMWPVSDTNPRYCSRVPVRASKMDVEHPCSILPAPLRKQPYLYGCAMGWGPLFV